MRRRGGEEENIDRGTSLAKQQPAPPAQGRKSKSRQHEQQQEATERDERKGMKPMNIRTEQCPICLTSFAGRRQEKHPTSNYRPMENTLANSATFTQELRHVR